MAEYQSVEHAVARHQEYPALDADLNAHDFQRRRVRSSTQFVRQGDIMLEVACNTGYVRDYCPQAAEIHGVDVNPKLVAIAETRLTSARVARAEALPFPDKSFDIVNVSGLLEQVFDPDPIMRECARVSRRSIVGNTTHERGCWGKDRTARHAWQSRSYSEAEIRAVLEKVGYIKTLGTVDINNPPEPQCWYFHVIVPEAAGEQS